MASEEELPETSPALALAEGMTLNEIDALLRTQPYVSGAPLPNYQDADVHAAIKQVPDPDKYPHLHAWWWSLSAFSPQAMNLWGTETKKVAVKRSSFDHPLKKSANLPHLYRSMTRDLP